MKSAARFRRGLEKIRRLCSADHYHQALAEAIRLLKSWPDNPHLLSLWGNLIQLQEDEGGSPTLEDAKAALARAVELDPESPTALVELGHFLYAVEDETRAGLKCFAKAIALSRRLLQEGLVGQAKALAELGRKPEALACLAEAYSLHARGDKASGDGRGSEELLEQLQDLAQAE